MKLTQEGGRIYAVHVKLVQAVRLLEWRLLRWTASYTLIGVVSVSKAFDEDVEIGAGYSW